MRTIYFILIFFTLYYQISAKNFSRAGNNIDNINDITSMTGEDKIWVESLLKYMPQSDIVEIDRQFIESDFNAIKKAKKQLVWSKKVPLLLFYRYILPYRVSQEPLNKFRSIYSDTLLDLINGIDDMHNAAIKINEWVFTHMKYKPTYGWDQSQITTIKRGFGRCEEMTSLFIMALRTVYIPARHVYAPWWPFTNSNHSWVEVWYGGKWHFIGGGEMTDFGSTWFTNPTKRTALVKCSAWGKLDSEKEPALRIDSMYSIMNVTKNYTITKNMNVYVHNKFDLPVDSADVSIYVYNYSAFRKIESGKTDKKGNYSICIGKTDLLIVVSKDSLMTWSIVKGDQDSVSLTLNNIAFKDTSFWFYTIPKIKYKKKVRKYKPDKSLYSIQKIHISNLSPIKENFKISMIDKDDSLLINLIDRARGNHKDILNIYDSLNNNEDKKDFIKILSSVDSKDLVTINSGEIIRYLNWYKGIKGNIGSISDSIVINYLLKPRVYYESFSIYEDTLLKLFPNSDGDNINSIVKSVIDYINTNIDTIQDRYKSRFGGILNPIQILKGKISRPVEKSILEVCILRSKGIPARLSYDAKALEYFNKKWESISREKGEERELYNLKIVFYDNEKEEIQQLRYYYDFTLNRFQDGELISLEPDISDDKDTNSVDLVPGEYILISGWRNVNGDTYARLNRIDLNNDSLIKKIECGIPYENIEKGMLISNDLKLKDNFKLIDIQGRKLNKKDLYTGEKIVIIFDAHSEASISTLLRLKSVKKLCDGKTIFISVSDKQNTIDFLKDLDIDCRIIISNKDDVKKIFKAHELPSIFMIKKGELIFWINGLNLNLDKMIREFGG